MYILNNSQGLYFRVHHLSHTASKCHTGSYCQQGATLHSYGWVASHTNMRLTFLKPFINKMCENWGCFASTAVMIGDQYIVSGRGSMAMNMTHPSLLDENHVKYHLHLTPDLLPEMEEVIVPGPLQQEINIQVRRKHKCSKCHIVIQEVDFLKYQGKNKSGFCNKNKL